jgi:hypothetical protein
MRRPAHHEKAASSCRGYYLSTYSPELNLIEILWADMKRDLRTLAVNVESELAAAFAAFGFPSPSRRSPAGFATPALRRNSTDHGFTLARDRTSVDVGRLRLAGATVGLRVVGP